jgi:8-oxo-dGTP diphosphatase
VTSNPQPSRERQRIAIAVVWHENQLLVGKRPPGVPLAGFWEFPGGKLQAEEEPEAAARRECLEETGVMVTVEELYFVERFCYDHATVELHFFRCRCSRPPACPLSPFRWVPLQGLDQYQFPPGNQRLLDYIRSPN